MTEPNYSPSDRRPIQSRNTRWAELVTNALVKTGLSPNAISVLGMLAAIGAGISFYATNSIGGMGQAALWFCGGVMCQIRLLCNLFDGMVAVKRGTASRKGELYNEVPDRVSDAAVFVGLGYSAGGVIALGYIAALVCVFVAYVRTTAKSVGAPNDFCGPMAKPQRMALATIVAFYLALIPVQWRLTVGEPTLVLMVVIIGGGFTAVRRLNRAAKFLDGPAQ